MDLWMYSLNTFSVPHEKGGTPRCKVKLPRKNNDEFNTCKSFMNSGKELGISRV